MKRRNRKRYMLNLLSLALLGIALYLNFIKKDTADASTTIERNTQSGLELSKTDATSLPVNHTSQTFVLK